MNAILMWQGWEATFVFWAFGVLIASLFPVSKPLEMGLTTGGAILFAEWAITYVARDGLGQAPAVVLFALTDCTAAYCFLRIATKQKAAWAALCVVYHAGMTIAHVQFLVGALGQFSYVLSLNLFYAASLASMTIAIAVGRHGRIRSFDRFTDRIWSGWTYSGVRIPSDSHPEGR